MHRCYDHEGQEGGSVASGHFGASETGFRPPDWEFKPRSSRYTSGDSPTIVAGCLRAHWECRSFQNIKQDLACSLTQFELNT
jgi:hypothetical protein